MKKILIVTILLFSIGHAFSQGNDSTKYVYYRYTYGSRLARNWTDTVMMIPKDTIWSKDGLALKNGVLYTGNHIKWSALAQVDSVAGLVKPPPDWASYTGSTPISRDTTIVLTCGTYSTKYLHYNLSQFIGFGVRAFSGGSAIPGIESSCIFGLWFFGWTKGTGDLYIYGVDTGANMYLQAFPY